MDPSTQKQSIIDRLKQANNILVTVSKNPSVDQLAAAIGFTLALNKIGKHGIAVFSGQVPSTIEFLKPEDTFEKNTDSLRDFIISLDKAKADKLRYKVEDDHVKIFITPYKSSLSDKDLEFSHGEFNVEVILAIGVKEQQDLDDAITSQGRILHDATVIDITTAAEATMGTLMWANPKASSLCEMVLSLTEGMKSGLLDAQISTAFLTGIVAETDRFSNERTTPEAMQASSKLMVAGANQQLVAIQLQPVKEPEPEPTPEPEPEPELPDPVEPEEEIAQPEAEEAVAEPEPTPDPEPEPTPVEKPSQDGSLEISHSDEQPESDQPTDSTEESEEVVSQIRIDYQGKILGEGEEEVKAPSQVSSRGMALEPPTMGGQLTANTETEKLDPSTDIMGDGANAPTGPMLSHQPMSPTMPAPESPQTLTSLEEAVNSPHLDAARNATEQAFGSSPALAPTPSAPEFGVIGANAGTPTDPTVTEVIDPVAPPPVPPPMMPPSFMPPSNTGSSSF